MDIKKIKELIDLFEQSDLSKLSVKEEGVKITLAKETNVQVITTPSLQAEPNQETEIKESSHVIKSPIVGTFYRAPSPESKSFVEVGDEVEVGQVLCVIESMKMMNEIASDIKGTITHIHLNNAEMVEYDQVLFSIEP